MTNGVSGPEELLNLWYTRFGAFWRAPTCARHWQLLALVGGEWRLVYEETDNYLRQCRAAFPPVTTSLLKLVVRSTNRGMTVRTQNRVFEGAGHPTKAPARPPTLPSRLTGIRRVCTKYECMENKQGPAGIRQPALEFNCLVYLS